MLMSETVMSAQSLEQLKAELYWDADGKVNQEKQCISIKTEKKS